jgi:hypothetical protein
VENGWFEDPKKVACRRGVNQCSAKCNWNRFVDGFREVGNAINIAVESVKQVVVTTILKLVDLVIKNLHIDIALEGNLGGTEGRADFLFRFNVTVVSTKLAFELRLDVGRTGQQSFVCVSMFYSSNESSC